MVRASAQVLLQGACTDHATCSRLEMNTSSTMNFRSLRRRNSQDNYFVEDTLSSPGRRQLWQRRSLSSSSSKDLQSVANTFGTLPRGRKQVERSNSLVDYSHESRTTVILEKQDNETFGFEVQTYGLRAENTSLVELCTFVSSVHQDSAAERAGLTTGDVIVTVNSVCTEGSTHQRIVDLIRESINVLTLETVSGVLVKKIELQRKLKQLKQNLQDKLSELHKLTVQECRFTGGNLNDCPSLSSLESLLSPVSRHGLRFSSESSCRSAVMEDSEDGLPSVFEDASPLNSPVDDCAFIFGSPPRRSMRATVSRTRSISLGSSGGGGSPSWDPNEGGTLFGTLPRRPRRGSVRNRIMKFIPGLHHSVEEEENS